MLVLFGAMMCHPAPAFAGFYQAGPFTGNGEVMSNPDFHYPAPYSTVLTYPRYGGSGPALWGTPQGYPASCTGDISVTFEWVGSSLDDNPPEYVIVAEDCTAQVQCSHGAGGTYTSECDNGLGFPSVTSTYGSPYYPNDVITSSGARYTLKQNPGMSFKITCSPKATLSGPLSSPSSGQGVASVSYSITATVLDIVLGGGIGPQGDVQYLIGQLCSASITGDGLTPSNYNWNVSGGDPFENWIANDQNASLIPLDPLLAFASSYSCYFKTPGSATVTCTVDLAVPPGAHPVGGFPGTTLSKTVTIDRPGFGLGANIGYVLLNPDGPVYGNVGLGGYAWGVNTSGIRFKGEANTPANYVKAYGAKGWWNVTQMVTSTISLVRNGEAFHGLMDGIFSLDTSYPYDGGWPSDGGDNYTTDSPSMGMSRGTTILHRLDSFRDWQMYQPPGANSCYVPLLKIKWYWNAQVQWFLPDERWHLVSSPGDCGWDYDGGPFPEFPQWSSNISSNMIVPNP